LPFETNFSGGDRKTRKTETKWTVYNATGDGGMEEKDGIKGRRTLF